MRALVCDRDGRLTRLDRNGGSWSADTLHDEVPGACVATDGERVLVGTQGSGALLSRDGGAAWERVELPEQDVLSVAISRADGALYAGTEPSRLFVSRDGEEWSELEALQDIPSAISGASRPARGRTTCAGSRPTRTPPSACSWGSSWAA